MNKQTKMLLGLVLVAGAGYYIWQKNKPAKKSFASKPKPKPKPKKSKSKVEVNPFEYTV
jgi:hypothetical protein